MTEVGRSYRYSRGSTTRFPELLTNHRPPELIASAFRAEDSGLPAVEYAADISK